MDKIEVTQSDIDCAEQVQACHSHIFAAGIIARHRLATRTDATPVATDVAALVEADLDWRVVARLAGEHGIRYRTNKALVQFLAALAPFTNGQP